MERIKQALEKARQERQTRQGTDTPATTTSQSKDGKAMPLNAESVRVDNAVLRENSVITGIDPGPFTNAYNLLRTQVLQQFKKADWNVLAVTSPGPSEGKTLTAINLAISIAREVDYTVLLVDANLGHPDMLDHFGLPRRKGLSDYLMDNAEISDLLFKIEPIDKLVILPGGKPLTNSAEMLNSPKMGGLVEEMKVRYQSRIIIFDLPPVLTSADTITFAPNVDAMLMVIEEGSTQKKYLGNAISLLKNTNIIGTVLNKAEVRNKH